MTTIQIKFSDIPSYLHSGDLYRSLDSTDSEGIIEVPRDCFHPDENEAAVHLCEICQQLKVMDFWMLDEIPVCVLNFCANHKVEVWKDALNDLSLSISKLVPHLIDAYSDLNGHKNFLLSDLQRSKRWELILHTTSITHVPIAVSQSAVKGDLRLLKHLHNKGYAWDKNTCKLVSMGGHLECLMYSRENGCTWNSEVYVAASRNGHLHCIQYAFEQGLEWHPDTCSQAALGGHLDCLRFAHENGCPWDSNVYVSAAQQGHLQCLKYAHNQGLEWIFAVCTSSAKGGHLACLQFAHQNGCPWNSSTTEAAAQEGHAKCLHYALMQGCPVTQTACNMACKNGHILCLHVLHQLNVPWDETTSCHAAECSSADCLRYLHHSGCPWDFTTSSHAAKKGNLTTLKYAMENGCPYNDYLMHDAVSGSSLACVQYLVEDHALYMDEEVFKIALLKGEMSCLQYLVDQGCPYHKARFSDFRTEVKNHNQSENVLEAFKYAMLDWQISECAQYAVDRGWELDKTFIDFANENFYFHWMEQNGHILSPTTSNERPSAIVANGVPREKFARRYPHIPAPHEKLKFYALMEHYM